MNKEREQFWEEFYNFYPEFETELVRITDMEKTETLAIFPKKLLVEGLKQ